MATFPHIAVTGGPGTAACDVPVSDFDHFLSVARAVLPEGYVAAMEATPGSGFEIIQAMARIAERVSLAVRRTGCGSLILFSTIGAKATGTVTLSRPSTATGAFTVRPGSIVGTADGKNFVTTDTATFGGGDLEATVTVEAVDIGYEYNVKGLYTSPTGQTIQGEIVRLVRLSTDPEYADPAVAVRNDSPTTGGLSNMLEGLGEDLNLPRSSSEPQESYRLRIRSLPDTISPDAILRNVTQFLAPYQLAFEFVELWSVEYQTCWDAPSTSAGTPSYRVTPPTSLDYDEHLFAYDDARDTPPWRNFWLDEPDSRGAFVIALERASIVETGMAYDDTAVVPGDLWTVSPPRQRGTGAFDVPFASDPDLIFPAAWDGTDVGFQQIATGLYWLLQRIRAAGVSATVERHRQF